MKVGVGAEVRPDMTEICPGDDERVGIFGCNQQSLVAHGDNHVGQLGGNFGAADALVVGALVVDAGTLSLAGFR